MYHCFDMQVWGTKLVRLYSPQYASKLHPFPNPFLRNTSQVSFPMCALYGEPRGAVCRLSLVC